MRLEPDLVEEVLREVLSEEVPPALVPTGRPDLVYTATLSASGRDVLPRMPLPPRSSS